tara:strand:- start:370 stop:609 length:240 start_codon:yes stop_codon:yes gene_type:complete
MHEITIQERSEYGMTRLYPQNKLGKEYAQRLGKKTLSHGDLTFIASLGVKVVPVEPVWTGEYVKYQLTNEAHFDCGSCS